jgi:hypothetical protein
VPRFKKRRRKGLKPRRRGTTLGKCQYCGDEIMWVCHVRTGTPAPLDLQRHEEADLKIENGTYRILRGDELTLSRQQGWHQLFLNHLRICTRTHEPEPSQLAPQLGDRTLTSPSQSVTMAT